MRKSKISQECGGWLGNETSESDLDMKYIGYSAISLIVLRDPHIYQLRLICPVETFFKRDR